jgi:hypothetical protein
MKRLVAALASAFLLAAAPARAQQTPQQITEQIDVLVQQLKAALAGPPSKVAYTAADLNTALATGGNITVVGTIQGNFVVTKPSVIGGTGTLTPADPFEATLEVKSNDVTVRGITILTARNDRETVVVGRNAAKTVAEQPHRVLFEDVTVLASAQGGKRGFSLHGVDITVRRANVRGFYADQDSQAVLINNGPGPYLIEDSFLEASGENVLLGGADPGIVGVVPSDVVVRRNILYKPDNYVQLGTVKNSFEIKNGRRVLFEGNWIDGNWTDGQSGIPIVLTVRNQQGACTWCVVDDVIVRGNRTTRTPHGYAVSILGADSPNQSQQTRRITVENNLFLESPRGFLIGNGVAESLVIRHNTMPDITGTFLAFYDTRTTPVTTPLTFVDNVLKQGEYGINNNDSRTYRVVEFAGNVIELHPDRTVCGPAAGNLRVPYGSLDALLDPTTYKLLSGTAGIQ